MHAAWKVQGTSPEAIRWRTGRLGGRRRFRAFVRVTVSHNRRRLVVRRRRSGRGPQLCNLLRRRLRHELGRVGRLRGRRRLFQGRLVAQELPKDSGLAGSRTGGWRIGRLRRRDALRFLLGEHEARGGVQSCRRGHCLTRASTSGHQARDGRSGMRLFSRECRERGREHSSYATCRWCTAQRRGECHGADEVGPGERRRAIETAASPRRVIPATSSALESSTQRSQTHQTREKQSSLASG